MLMVQRFRTILREKNLSSEEVERRAGLRCAYICGVENGQIIPSVAVWERIAMALEVPLANLFYDGEGRPHLPNLPGRKTADDIAGVTGNSGH
jgi:transcriptional regulator with XRE-family HTH domain